MTTRAHITLVVDRSGSMTTTRTDAEGGIRTFLAEQAKLDGVKVTVSLYQFDAKYEHVYGPVKIKKAPDYSLQPRGMTALYDAVGKSIVDTKEHVDSADPKVDKVVLVVVTDGAENSSKEHNFESVTELVKAQKDEGWEVIFLASDLKAAHFGRAAGLNTTTYNPTSQGTHSVYGVVTRGTASYLTGKTAHVDMPDTVSNQ